MGRQSKFTWEEKEAAVLLVTEGGRSIPSVANEYGVHENTIGKWKRQLEINPNRGRDAEPVTDEDKEKQRLQRRVQELEAEVEFLKKVSAYFAKNPR